VLRGSPTWHPKVREEQVTRLDSSEKTRAEPRNNKQHAQTCSFGMKREQVILRSRKNLQVIQAEVLEEWTK
jgi:hypothetical protein